MSPENISLKDMWILTICITVATYILYIFLKNRIKLGFKGITTWRFESVDKLHEEHGKFLTIWSTFIFGYSLMHLLHLLSLWVGVILWTLGIFDPHS
jgi:hypothetical protein